MKRIASLLITALLVLTFAVSLNAGNQQPASDGPVTIEWWALSGGGGANDPSTELKQEVVDSFMAANPNIKINMTILEVSAFKQKIQLAVQSGTPPHLFHSWGGGVMVEYANAGQLQDITSFVDSTLSKKIGMGPLGVYSYEGKYYGSPYDMGGVGFWYNKAIFAKAGIQVPQTWPQMLDCVQKIRAAGYIPVSLGGGDKWPAHYWWVYLAMRIGGQAAFDAAYSGNGSFKDDTFVKAGEKLLELVALDPFQTGFLAATYDDEASLMGNGHAAMELMGQWAGSVQSANSESGNGIEDDLGWFSFPSVPGGVGSNKDVMGGGNGYVVGKGAPVETLKFLDYFLSKEHNMKQVGIEGIIPVVKGAEEALADDPNVMAIAKAVSNAEYYQLYYDQFLPPAVGAAVNDAVVELMAGKATPAEAAAMIDDVWQMEK